MIHRYTVIGQPIAHSLSPDVHHIFAELNQRKVRYTRTESTPETFGQTVQAWQDSGAKGCNVTSPFKEQAFALCDKTTDQAQLAGSVNTIRMSDDGMRYGYNTDGAGLVFDIQNNKSINLLQKRLLILGAGGATRGVISPLLAAEPNLLCIANRTSSKAISLAKQFEHLGNVCGGGFSDLDNQGCFDVIINATTLSLDGQMPAIPTCVVSSTTFAYDMTYAASDTVFMLWAQQHGANACNGLGMLVEQAAESFAIWEGVRPITKSVYPKLQLIIDQRQQASKTS